MSDNWNFDGLVQDVLVKSGNNSCCGDISFPDTHKLDNPSNPQSTISNDLLNEFEKYLQELGIIEVAYVNGINDYFLHGLNFDFNSAIVISYEISKSIHDEGAGDKAQAFNNELYESFGNITYEISDYLRSNGFETMVAHPREETIDFSHLAQKAGMGAIGKSGLLISPKKGPNQKIAAILVNIENLPLLNCNKHEWISRYCNYCNSCVKACPQEALIINRKNKNVEFIADLCIGCTKGCVECIKACPFYKKGYEHVFKKYKKLEAKLS